MPLFLTQDDQDHSQKMRCTQLANGEGPSSWARWLCASHLQTWKVATGVMICRASLIARIYAEHVRWNRETLPLHIIRDLDHVFISQSCKAYIQIIKFGGIVQKTSTERHWLSAVELPRPVQASHIVSHRLTKVRGQFSARLWDVELSNCRFQAWFQRRMKQQFVPGKRW